MEGESSPKTRQLHHHWVDEPEQFASWLNSPFLNQEALGRAVLAFKRLDIELRELLVDLLNRGNASPAIYSMKLAEVISSLEVLATRRDPPTRWRPLATTMSDIHRLLAVPDDLVVSVWLSVYGGPSSGEASADREGAGIAELHRVAEDAMSLVSRLHQARAGDH